MTAVELPTDMSAWACGTRHFQLTNGSFVAIEVDQGQNETLVAPLVDEVTRGAAYRYVQRPTVVIETDENGYATSLERLHEFPPGTSCEDALAAITFPIDGVAPHRDVEPPE